MTKNILNKLFVFNAVFLAGIFCIGDALAECVKGSADYVSCMEKQCASRSGYEYSSKYDRCIKHCDGDTEYFPLSQKCVKKCREGWEHDTAGVCQPKTKKAKKELEELQNSCSEGTVWSTKADGCVSRCPSAKVWDSQTQSCVTKTETPVENNDVTIQNGEDSANGNDDTFVEGNAFDENDDELVGEDAFDEKNVTEPKVEINTVINDNGKVSNETETKDIISGEGSGGSDVSSSDSSAQQKAAEDAKEAEKKNEEEAKAKEKEQKEAEKYDGLYNGRHIIPDIMAMHCKIKGEDVAKDPELFINCIKQYVAEMNNSNATAKAEAEREFEMLKYKVLTDAGSTAMTKAQVVGNHVETMNKQNNAHENMKTESDDNKSITASLSFVTNMMNDIRELQVEQLKYMVISGIGDIDPSVAVEADEKATETQKETAKSTGDGKGPSVFTVNSKAEIKQ